MNSLYDIVGFYITLSRFKDSHTKILVQLYLTNRMTRKCFRSLRTKFTCRNLAWFHKRSSNCSQISPLTNLTRPCSCKTDKFTRLFWGNYSLTKLSISVTCWLCCIIWFTGMPPGSSFIRERTLWRLLRRFIGKSVRIMKRPNMFIRRCWKCLQVTRKFLRKPDYLIVSKVNLFV